MAEAMVPSTALQQRILYEMEKAYKPAVWVLPDDYLSRQAFERALTRLELSSSPGWPYMTEAPTNRDWLQTRGIEHSPFRVERLWHDVQLVFADRWDHVLRVFIKQEPHKESKVKENRWRLIMAASLPVQIAWHMLFDYGNDTEISKALDIPSQQGIKLPAGEWKHYVRLWKSRGYDCGIDKSAWDWTAPSWALELDLELRYRLGRGTCMTQWRKAADLLWKHMFRESVLLLPTGHLYKQVTPGIMKSGCVNTISSNSHMQAMMHILSSLELGKPIQPLPVCCGDDTLQCSWQVSDLSVYEKYGVVVKSVTPGLEFVGHEFGPNGPQPLYLAKHISSFIHSKAPPLDYLDSMCRLYAHSPYRKFWELLALEMGVVLPMSSRGYLYWYDTFSE